MNIKTTGKERRITTSEKYMRLVLTEFHLADYEINKCIHNFVYFLCSIQLI